MQWVHGEVQSYWGHVTHIWETATFSIGCVNEFHVAAMNKMLPSFSFLPNAGERWGERANETLTVIVSDVLWWETNCLDTDCWKFRSHCWGLIHAPRIADLPKANSICVCLAKRWMEHERKKTLTCISKGYICVATEEASRYIKCFVWSERE